MTGTHEAVREKYGALASAVGRGDGCCGPSACGCGDPIKDRRNVYVGEVTVVAAAENGTKKAFTVTARIDTPEELVAFRHGGILPYVVRQLVARS